VIATLGYTYTERLEALRRTKMEQTAAKSRHGARDRDDHGDVLPPDGFRFVPSVINDPSGAFFGAAACGANFRAFLEAHPVYVDPMSSLAGAYVAYFHESRPLSWKPELGYSHLHREQARYGLVPGIGGSQHFAADVAIGLSLGWGGLLARVRHFREINRANPDAEPGLYDGLEDVLLGIQDWISRTASRARNLAATETQPEVRANLERIAEQNGWLIGRPPRTFREACQWLAWFQMVAQMYNGSGALAQLDETLRPYYERDVAAGILTDDEAIFHIVCLLLTETAYSQVGGQAPDGSDRTSRVSYLILEAAHRLHSTTNIGVRVWDGMDPAFFSLAVRYLLEDKVGSPYFLGDQGLNEGFVRNGYPVELARQRIKTGCHWCAIPGREYTLNDVVKINFGSVFDVALRELLLDQTVEPTVEELWTRFERHLRRGVEVTAEGIAFHLDHMWEVFPELVLDLMCHGTLERGRDASHGGVDLYDMCIDGTALATVADSFAAVEQRVEREGRLSWQELLRHLDADFSGAEDIRLMLRAVPRYGRGGTRADAYAARIAETFARVVKETERRRWFKLIPGLFSWANTIPMGKTLGATPNGRHAGAPISHGASPDPGFTSSGAPTAMAVAVAAVQPGYGNTAPLQLDLDPGLSRDDEGQAAVEALIRGHFALGGTLINMNVLDREQILEAHEDPSKHPDLIVRVTGFSAYFALLSKEFRQLVVDRIISGM
jgi:pyruvate-formate lyase